MLGLKKKWFGENVRKLRGILQHLQPGALKIGLNAILPSGFAERYAFDTVFPEISQGALYKFRLAELWAMEAMAWLSWMI